MDIAKLALKLLEGHPETGAFDVDAATAADQANVKNMVREIVSVTGQQVFEATTENDYAALTDAQKTVYWGILGLGEILVNGTNTKARLLSMFGAGTDTRANLAALQTKIVSWAVYEGFGFVYPGHIQNARM